MTDRPFSFAALLVFASFMLLGGCGTTEPSRFYLLTQAMEPDGAGQDGEEGPAIEIGPVSLPDYLDRQQIVVRTGPNELRLAEFDRWAEPLEANFTRVLAGNLSDLLMTNRVTLYSDRRGAAGGCRVAVEVTRFEGGPDGTVTLEAWWTLFKASGNQPVFVRRSCIRKPAGSAEDFAALVLAQSQALDALSREIADGIEALEKEASG